MLVSLLTVAVLVSAQASTDPATSGEAPPPPAQVVAAPPAPSPPSAPAPDAKPAGMDVVPTAAAQCGAGVAGCCVGTCVAAPCSLIPFVGLVTSPLIVGTAIGASETVVGDALGQKRAALLWPVVASVGIMATGALANLGLSLALGLGASALDPRVFASGALPAAYIASSAVSLGTLVLAGVVPVIIYQFTGVDKEPGDAGGFGMPGIMAPADPTGTRATKQASPSPSSAAPASSSPPPTATPNVGY
jgi:hypothetical protein